MGTWLFLPSLSNGSAPNHHSPAPPAGYKSADDSIGSPGLALSPTHESGDQQLTGSRAVGGRRRQPTDSAYFIAKELLTTERTYGKDLDVILVVSCDDEAQREKGRVVSTSSW